MNLECDKVRAIRTFLDSIGYGEWRYKIIGGINVKVHGHTIDWSLGTTNFEALARSIDYK